MFLPTSENRITYSYSSNVITINLTLTQEKLTDNLRLFMMEAPFVGKYHALLSENENEIKLFSFGKGLFYGNINDKSILQPIFILDKKSIIENELKIQNMFILSCYEKNTQLIIGNKEYNECKLFKLTYDSGSYSIYIKEDLGILLVRNIKNNKIVEEILLKEL